MTAPSTPASGFAQKRFSRHEGNLLTLMAAGSRCLRLKLSALLVCSLGLFCPNPASAVPAVEDIVMYEVNLRAFSDAGNLAGVTARLDDIQSLGANVIWLMPIHPIGQINSAGGLGSPYSVANYTQVSSEYGTLSDLTTLVDQAHQRGMYVVMDWVANHTAWDNPWIVNTDWYTQNAQGEIISPAGTGWNDVADLNYDNTDMRAAMVSAMQYWVTEVGIDGYRADAADFVPYDFWQDAIASVRVSTTRDLLMLAEGARSDHYAAGFDMTYGWDFYGTVQNVFNSSASATTLYQRYVNEFSSVPTGSGILQFTTNHDESAWDATPVELFGSLEASLAAYAVTVAYGGTPLVYNGQEIGWEDNIPFFTKAPLDWDTGQTTEQWYTQLLNARADHAALRQGSISDQSTSDVAFLVREYEGDQVLVMVNTRNASRQVQVPVSLQGSWSDLLSVQSTTLSGTRTLAPYEVVILGKTVVPAFVVAGELQTEQGDPADWDPTNSSLIMAEAGGIHSVTVNNLVNGVAYDFKVVNDQGSPPAEWGDPEITPNQLTVIGDADGSITITVDTNSINNLGEYATWINFDNAPLQVVGDFMTEAGGAADWDPYDDAFNMTDKGGGYYTFDAVISTPGIYQFKATFGNGWDDQVGTDGFNNDAITKGFEITEADQSVTLYVDLASRELGVLFFTLEGDLNGDGFVGLDDLDIVLAAWNQSVPPANSAADPSGDGFVGLDDLDIVLNHWNEGTPPTSNVNIPEPASLICLTTLSAVLLRHTRQSA